MNHRVLLLLLVALLGKFCNAFGGKLDDTLHIEEVEIHAPKAIFLPGTKFETIDSSILAVENTESIAKVLGKYSNLYVHVNSGISTVHFRGASPDHTAVLFDGVNFNSLTLGHSNLSNIPAFFFDEAYIQYGGSSALFGSGAIAGTIHLKTKPSWEKGVSLTAQQDVASFNTYFTGGKIRCGTGKLELSTKLYYKNSKNDFPFKNTSVYLIEEQKYVNDRQKNNAYENMGLLQEVFYKVKPNLVFSALYYGNENWRQIQLNKSDNYHGGSNNEIENSYDRLTTGLQYTSKLIGDVNVRFSYVDDFQLYNKTDTVSTQQYISNFEYDKSFSFHGSLNAGIKYIYINPYVHAYKNIEDEIQIEYFASYSQLIKEKTRVAINLRETTISGFKPVFSPAFNISHTLRAGVNSLFKLTGSASKSFRIPTFNDRYWGTQGNPNLKPERGINFETASEYHYSKNSVYLKTNVSLFSMVVKDWIEWRPDEDKPDYWRPLNQKVVWSRGIETSICIKKNFSSNASVESGINYSFNKAEPVEVYQGNEQMLNRQLLYVPSHTSNIYVSLIKQRWGISPDASFVGKRFSDERNKSENKIAPGYWLLNMSISRLFALGKSGFNLSFTVNNILNNQYENHLNYAMPGVNWRVSVKYSFNNIITKK